VGYGVVRVDKTRFKLFKSCSATAPNRQATGYIVLCIALRQKS
jgi:hypothetical protein